MGGEDFQEEAVLAAVKPLKAVQSSADGAESSADYAERVKQGSATDTDLALSKDSTSLEALFQTHHDRVFRTAYRVTSTATHAEYPLQTVFLRVARGQEAAETAD